jgi:drug/metabolite transporter (DMT)-like permease
MNSPFSSFKEFSEAKGPIYTFANNPTMIGFLLVVCLAITVYFFYASYTMKHGTPAKTPGAIGLLLVAGAASILGMEFAPQSHKQPETSRHPQAQRSVAHNWQPLALLGLVSTGGTQLGRKRRSPRRKPLRRPR